MLKFYWSSCTKTGLTANDVVELLDVEPSNTDHKLLTASVERSIFVSDNGKERNIQR